ncbi:hypothetical protein [Nocardia wallacei]|uniref:hypothetical protein n=1 Tax=Nocardia wallacei TaxID=480035 RepID=UPI0024574C7D|nr:hypothetical protein [Nocardia wallacei]
MATRSNRKPTTDPFEEISDAALEVVWQLIRAVFVLVWWSVLFPMISLPIAGAVAAGVLVSWVLGVVVVGVFLAGIMLWRWKRPEMFERWITARARRRFLTWWRYRSRWDKRLDACNLTVRCPDATAVFVPRLMSVEIGESVDRLRVRMVDGQCPDDYENRVERIAHTFGAQNCRATVAAPGVMELALRQSDSLAESITLPRLDGPGRTGNQEAA